MKKKKKKKKGRLMKTFPVFPQTFPAEAFPRVPAMSSAGTAVTVL